MISILVYGRNDNYGYNLHKRVALSLNNFSLLLQDEDDEIVFVDYNSPRGLPTLVEAIKDTLTERTMARIQVVKIDAEQHEKSAPTTHLKVLEPVARNAGVRRSNPRNRWILSTNTDMLFVEKDVGGIHETLANLPPGQYGLPRLELPLSFWESLPRSQPEEAVSMVRSWERQFQLHNIALSHEPHRFDAPGDFQLVLREDFFEVCGFDESMTRGWHVDSNLAKRLSFERGSVKSLQSVMSGYHCEHTQGETPMHAPNAVSNSLKKYFFDVKGPQTGNSPLNWGLADLELQVNRASDLVRAQLPRRLEKFEFGITPSPSVRRYNTLGFDRDEPIDEALLIFLLDLIEHAGRGLSFAWVGSHKNLFDRFIKVVQKDDPDSGFIFIDASRPWRHTKSDVGSAIDSDYVVIDNRPCERVSQSSRKNERGTLKKFLIFLFLKQSPTKSPRVVGINFVNTSQSRLFQTLVSAKSTPYVLGFLSGEFRSRTFRNLSIAGRAVLWAFFAEFIRRKLSTREFEALLSWKRRLVGR